MTKKLEDSLNLPRLSDALREKEEEALKEEAIDILKDLDKVEQLNKSLEDLNKTDLVGNDKEIKEVYTKALTNFDDLVELAVNVDAKYSGQFLGPAVQSLKIALDAQNSRTDKTLKIVRLHMEMDKLKLEAERNKQAERRLQLEERKMNSNVQEMDVLEGTDGSVNMETSKTIELLRKMMKNDEE